MDVRFTNWTLLCCPEINEHGAVNLRDNTTLPMQLKLCTFCPAHYFHWVCFTAVSDCKVSNCDSCVFFLLNQSVFHLCFWLWVTETSVMQLCHGRGIAKDWRKPMVEYEVICMSCSYTAITQTKNYTCLELLCMGTALVGIIIGHLMEWSPCGEDEQ